MSKTLLALSLMVSSLAGCGDRRRPVFELQSPERTGVTFANTITESDSLNVQTDVYIYNGAGVAVGDVDNDGLPDLFFAGNMVSSRLYLNKGGMRFEDVTARAGVGTTRWATGATMADVNGDGYLDIYVSVAGPEWSKGAERANLLFINNRDKTFTESAAAYGVADTSFTTHAAFLDYDGDGCLDLFLLNNSPTDFSRGEAIGHPSGMKGQTPGSHNELFRNDCHGAFTDVSARAGILRDAGYGLGVVATDVNRDGRPDIYVSNDANPNDVLYVNTGDGTFVNQAPRWLKHSSFAGMGVDIADFNNDGWPDVVQADMLAGDPVRRKRTTGYLTFGNFLEWRSRGFRDDYSVNSLQLSNGVTPSGDLQFSNIAHLAGVAATDWSWSALFADFDNDGNKDIFISNGYPKGVNDLDYQGAAFRARGRARAGTTTPAALALLRGLPGYDEPNHIFRNAGDLTFVDESAAWGLEERGYSYGAAYADLDNDGRLDLVVSNIDAPAMVYRNVGPNDDDAHHWLQLRLQSERPQLRGVGATVVLTAGGRRQYVYHTPYRGYMSTMDDRVHFGLGRDRRVDSLEVLWPDGRRQLLTGLDADRLLVVKQSDATERRPLPPAGTPPLPQTPDHRFDRLAAAGTPAYVHHVAASPDYSVQSLLPYMVSRQGPPLAVGDVDGDRLDDVYVGGGGGTPGMLYLQRPDGGFARSPRTQPWARDSTREDWGALFFDANGDGKPDLYVASGGYQVAPTSRLLQDRLYINQGAGAFALDSLALPAMLTSTAAVRAGDFNGDGRPDLFVGGRLTPRQWPFPTRSYVLRNDRAPDGGVRFTDVTEQVAPELVRPGGMITDAVWMDFDGDRRLDLVTAGEWMPIAFYRNDGARLRDVTGSTRLPPMRGWWYSLAAGDFDGDGRPDLVAGNLGLNSPYRASREARFGVYASNFTGGQNTEIVLTEERGGTEYPYAGLALLGRQMYSLGLRFPTHASFAGAAVSEIFTPAQLQQALHLQADTFASVFLHNDGGGVFTAAALPRLAQLSPVRAILVDDLDGDGCLDALIAGNIYDTEPNTSRADAGNGLWLRGDGRGHLTPVPPARSGFLAPGNVAGMALVATPRGKVVLVANTADSLQAFSVAGGRR